MSHQKTRFETPQDVIDLAAHYHVEVTDVGLAGDSMFALVAGDLEHALKQMKHVEFSEAKIAPAPNGQDAIFFNNKLLFRLDVANYNPYYEHRFHQRSGFEANEVVEAWIYYQSGRGIATECYCRTNEAKSGILFCTPMRYLIPVMVEDEEISS